MTSLIGLGVPQRASVFQQNNPLNVLEFDATTNENHTGDVDVTDHPVEEGSDITDHVRRNPESVQLNAIVSNNPILVLASLRALPSVRGGDPASRAEDAYGFLKENKDAGEVMGASTTLRDYANMIIRSLSVTRDKDTGNIVSLNITLREIIIAQTETVDAPEPTNAARKNKTSLGKKTTPDASPATTSKLTSVLTKIGNAFGL